MSLVVYRIVHPPVTRESGVRLPARETLFRRCHNQYYVIRWSPVGVGVPVLICKRSFDMNNVSFPIHLVTLIRRLFNVISTISLTNQYILSRIQADKHVSEDRAGQPGLYSRLIDRPYQPAHSRWKWLTPEYTYTWTSNIRFVCPDDRRSGICSDHASGSYHFKFGTLTSNFCCAQGH